jgi:protease I
MQIVKYTSFLCILLLAGCAVPSQVEEKEVEQIPGAEGKSVLMIIAPVNFRDEEFLEPKAVFEKNRMIITIASKGVKTAKGMLGATAEVDKDMTAVNVDEYDAVVFVGGTGASVYFEDSTALTIAKEAYEKGKIVAAICIAPSILANAGILSGKKATCFSSESSNLETQGATYTGSDLEVDGKIITASGPAAASKFGMAIAEALSEG